MTTLANDEIYDGIPPCGCHDRMDRHAEDPGGVAGATGYPGLLGGRVKELERSMVDPTLHSVPAHRGWVLANVLSFLEGAHRGADYTTAGQSDVVRESRVRLRGATFGLRAIGGMPDRSWRWYVPVAGSLSDADLAVGFSVHDKTSEIWGPDGRPHPREGLDTEVAFDTERALYEGDDSAEDTPNPHVKAARDLWTKLFGSDAVLKKVTILDYESVPSDAVRELGYDAWTNSNTRIYVAKEATRNSVVLETTLRHEAVHIRQFAKTGRPDTYEKSVTYELEAYRDDVTRLDARSKSLNAVARRSKAQNEELDTVDDLLQRVQDTVATLETAIKDAPQPAKGVSDRERFFRHFLISRCLLPYHRALADLYAPPKDQRNPSAAESVDGSEADRGASQGVSSLADVARGPLRRPRDAVDENEPSSMVLEAETDEAGRHDTEFYDSGPFEADGYEAEGGGVVTARITDALANRDWPGALRIAIEQGWRDDTQLANLVFFARHPELAVRPLDTKTAADAKLAHEWVAIREGEVWKAIETSARNAPLGVSGSLAAAGHRLFWGPAGRRFKDLVVAAARDVDLDPGLLAATLLAETFRDSFLTSGKVSSYEVGTDDFYERRGALAAAVAAYRKVGWDRHQTPREHLNDAQSNPRTIKTIDFNSGPDALLGCAVYLKYGEIALRRFALARHGDFDVLPVEVRFALTRMAFAAGPGGARKRLEKALDGKDFLVRNDTPLEAYHTDRNATVRAAQALHLDEWIFRTGVPAAAHTTPAPMAPTTPKAGPAPEEFAAAVAAGAMDEIGQSSQWVEGEDTVIGRMLRDVAARVAVDNALDRGERGENPLTDAAFNARHTDRPAGPIRREEPRFVEFRDDWLDVRSRIVRPALVERAAKDRLDRLVPRGRPSSRLCCLVWTTVLDPGSLGTQGDPSEALGEVFTDKLGFIDLGHARETADVTLWALNQIQAVAGAAAHDIELFHGKARLLVDIPMARRLALAQQLAYVDSVVHEIETFGVPGPGMDNSSFSPEDLSSNLFGTLVAAGAFAADGGSNAAITNELKRMLTNAGAQAEPIGRAAQAVAEHRGWWVASGPQITFPLGKRNLAAVPWLVDVQGGSARIQPSRLLVSPPLTSPDFTYESNATHTKNADFQARIDAIRASLPASTLIP